MTTADNMSADYNGIEGWDKLTVMRKISKEIEDSHATPLQVNVPYVQHFDQQTFFRDEYVKMNYLIKSICFIMGILTGIIISSALVTMQLFLGLVLIIILIFLSIGISKILPPSYDK